jgi:transposase
MRWVGSLRLDAHARLQVDALLAVIAVLEVQLEAVDGEFRRFARADARCHALQSIYGVGPIVACHLLAEIGEACRFRRAKQITRLAGLDPVVDESGETAISPRPAHRSCAGPWSKRPCTRTGRRLLISSFTSRCGIAATPLPPG